MNFKLFDNDAFDAVDAYKAQEEYCKKHRVPMFCSDRCCGTEQHLEGHNPYTNISVNYALSVHIVSCPICGKSLCD